MAATDTGGWGTAAGWGPSTTAAPADDPWGAPAPAKDGFDQANTGFDYTADATDDNYATGNGGDNAGDGGFGGDNDRPRGCFNCGEDGHNKSECPQPEKPRACFNCGQDGHSKLDCPNPRVFTGTCNICNKEGHMRKDCPDKPPMTCRMCDEEGHTMFECQNARKISRSNIPDIDPEDAWNLLVTAIEERDIDDVKDAIAKYLKHYPEMTYVELHTALRSQNLNMWIIATERQLVHTYTNMDLQGNVGKKYTVSYRFTDKPERPREAPGWPTSEEDMVARLHDAGEVVDSGMRKCRNCDQEGHITKNCPEDKQERDRVAIMCYNCNEAGHRVRDCPLPRTDKFACKNCGQPGHKVSECTEPRSAEGVECRKCNEIGHFSRDCPTAPSGPRGCRNCGQEGHMSKECTEPLNMENVKCRNCDEMGHFSKECPKPRDWSRVTCSNCGETGHTKVKCRAPPKVDDGFDTAGGDGGFDAPVDGGFDAPVDGGFDAVQTSTAAPTTDDWGTPANAGATNDNWGEATAPSGW